MNNSKIIDESLKESSSFSSNVHGIETITSENSVVSRYFDIPQRYYKSKVVLLPVNTKKFYVYWEFTDELLESLSLSASDVKFHIVDNKNNLVFEFDCTYPVGEYFINKEFDSFSVQAIAGYYKDGKFINILEPSNILKLFDAKLKFADKQKDVWIKKEKGFTEIIRASLQHFTLGMSSKSYVEEIERLKQYEREMIESLSSKDLVEGN